MPRLFNYLCIAYGGAPRTFQPLWNDFIKVEGRYPSAVAALDKRRIDCLGLRAPQELFIDRTMLQKCINDALNYKPDSTPDSTVAELQRDLWRCETANVPPPVADTSEYEQVRQAFNLRIMPYVDPDALAQLRGRRSPVTKPSN